MLSIQWMCSLTSYLYIVGRIQPIRLSRDFTGANVNVNVSGWGKTSDGKFKIIFCKCEYFKWNICPGSLTVSPTLNYVTLRSISNNECSQHYGSVIKSSTICCKGNPQHSTCNVSIVADYFKIWNNISYANCIIRENK